MTTNDSQNTGMRNHYDIGECVAFRTLFEGEATASKPQAKLIGGSIESSGLA